MPVTHTTTASRPTGSDVLVPLNPTQTSTQPAQEMSFGADYMVKQYGTDALISGGTIAAGVFIFAPEPIVTKIIGGTLALSALAAGGLGSARKPPQLLFIFFTMAHFIACGRGAVV